LFSSNLVVCIAGYKRSIGVDLLLMTVQKGQLMAR
jgi:hypothetical protein